MSDAIRSWLQARRYRAVLRDLHSTNSAELAALGIKPTEFDHLAIEVARS